MRIYDLYKTLYKHFGNLNWWPAKTPYEVIIGAVLTQNTAWSNVVKAIDNLKPDITPETIERMDLGELSYLIRSAGYYNQKAVYLKAVTAWFALYDYDIEKIKQKPLFDVRTELLKVKGIGNETADSILLYAFDFLTFVIDAYTMRLCKRYSIDAGSGYLQVKSYFEKYLPADVNIYNNFHALIVINAKNHCRTKPLCGECPLNKTCKGDI